MSEADFVWELLDRYARAPDAKAKLQELKETLDKYELSETDRRDIEAVIEHELGSTGEEKEKEMYSEGKGEAVEEVLGNEAKLVELVTSFKTNPDGLADIVEDGISPALKVKFAAAIRARMERTGAVGAIDWEKNVGEILERCEKGGGIPQFRTRYASERFEDREHPERFLVLFICYGRHWGQWLCSVPLEDVERLEAD